MSVIGLRSAMDTELLLGQCLAGRYELENVIGRGGTAVAFSAFDTREQARVAVKILTTGQPSNNAMVFRLLQEAKVTASLQHPNIVALKDWGIHADQHAFLVMELLSGHTLDEELAQRRRLDEATTLALLLPIVGAVAYAHDRGVLHRDIKPHNIFLSRAEDGRVTPKLLDFGIAKAGLSHYHERRHDHRHAGLHATRAGTRRAVEPQL